MAFNKIWVALALMLAVATIADARPDLSQFVKKKENDACCDACTCDEYGSCMCNDKGINSCPSSCENCICTRSFPAFCYCLDKMQTCPSKCTDEKDGCCDECECEKEGSCMCTHKAVGGCPSSCKDDVCLCTRSMPPTCWCSTVVDACPASKSNAINNQLQFIHLHNINKQLV